ncbi:hypothetical protein SUGI_1180560 [Cryptomeria japonica]|uniref:F-box/kelch-repeat protein At5g15710-like n=1 Tax=Cryptomeria japonica TaxID=3369 RepID=UPI0024149068|nr:F-box/kelch-repeat protein At5g15710-like [Cryptomeria japonica]GLJ54989.1 hypothetical protein SUGI_1180560 [Cryptomeria japonica]
MDTKCMDVIKNEDEGLERSELLLNTMEEKGSDTVGNENSDEESVWSEFPDHIVEEIFSNLLFEFTLPFRIVCKQWNKLLSSNRFLCSLAESDPWILLCSSTHCMAYCFLTQSWKTLSLSFLPSRTTKSLSLGNSRFCSSGAGLLVIEFGCPRKYMICNPITRTYRYIPPVISQSATLSEIMDNGESYKIVGVTHERNPGSLQIYHFSKGSFQIELELPLEPRDFPVSHICCAKGLLMCVLNHGEFVVWNMEDKQVQRFSFPYPNLYIPGGRINTWTERLVVCVSSILFVRTYYSDSVLTSFVIVWELFQEEESSIWSWKEMSRMPPDLCRKFFNARSIKMGKFSEYETFIVGNFLCFRSGYRNTKLFVYSLHDKCWSRIRVPDSVRFRRYNTNFEFQPKPGMKI